MSSFAAILPLFLNWPVGLTVLALILGAVAIGAFEGWPALLKDALNPRYWLVIAGAIGLAAFLNAGQTIQQQKQQIATDKAIITSTADSGLVVQHTMEKKQQNVVISRRIQHIIDTAPVGTQEDAVWDAIAEEEHPEK